MTPEIKSIDPSKIQWQGTRTGRIGIPLRKTPKPHWSHAYYVKPGITDVDKMRDEAAKAAAGDYYVPEGICSIIHYHRLLEGKEQRVGCNGARHEEFHRKGCTWQKEQSEGTATPTPS
jgi:hypothetical protein